MTDIRPAPEQLRELVELAKKATPGSRGEGGLIVCENDNILIVQAWADRVAIERHAQAAFTEAARNAIPAIESLLSETAQRENNWMETATEPMRTAAALMTESIPTEENDMTDTKIGECPNPWSPISRLPPEDVDVLLFWSDDFPMDVGLWNGNCWQRAYYDMQEYDVPPIFWMHLPEPPISEDKP